MTEKISLIDRAERDLECSAILLDRAESDELFQDIAAYHVQQAVEKTLKFWLAMSDVQSPRTHDIFVLLDALEKQQLQIPEWLYENGDLLNSYASKTRYGTSIVGTKRKISELSGKVAELIKRLKPEMIEKVTAASPVNDEDMDEFFRDAVEFLIQKGKASTSMLQRQFRIGYNRASRLMEELENRGIVGPEDGVKPRKILITREEYITSFGG